MKPLYLFTLLFLGIGGFQSAYAQTITVNSTTPCFLNYTAGADMWRNCGIEDDFLTFITLPWEWITGGYFSMALTSVLVLATWLHYKKLIYPILIGLFFLPISYSLFPSVFLMWSIILAFFGIFFLIYYAFIKQTRDF